MNENIQQADSYMRVIRLEDQWAVRYAVLIEEATQTIMQPIEWFGEDLSHGIELTENAAWGLIESGI